jgi:hypothetical protein
MPAPERRVYEVRRGATTPSRSLHESRALSGAFELPPSPEDFDMRQEAIGHARREVPVPEAESSADAAEEQVSDEPEADITE